MSGDFTNTDWSAGPYFIKTKTDPTGGTSYTITGTSQFLLIPYALHAKTNVNGDDRGDHCVQTDFILQGVGTSTNLLRLTPPGLHESYDHHGINRERTEQSM